MLTKRLIADDDVLFVLDRVETEQVPSGETVLRLSGQLNRKLYERVNKVLETLGGKWNRKIGGHLFPASQNPVSSLMALIDTGELEIEKLDFFPTPPEICEQMIELSGVTTDAVVLEPSAGMGAICQALTTGEGALPIKQVHFCEIDEGMAHLLTDKGYTFKGRDFLAFTGQYSYILMNPPFSGQRDIAHVLHAFDCLMHGGRLVSVMAESAFFREDRKSRAFRDFLSQYGRSVDLPVGAFKASGTGVKTRLVVLEK